MAQPRRYAFETEFSADGSILREAAKPLSPEEAEALCADAYERGKRDALAQAERCAAEALSSLADAASGVLSRLDAESRAVRAEAARVAMTAARKIAGEALDGFGVERAAAAVEAAMDALRHQPRLVVKLPTQTAESLSPRIAQMREAHAYASAVLVRADPQAKAGEISIDWSDGVVSLSPEETARRISDLIDAALASNTVVTGSP